ncbi:MAG: hypothetical protein ACFCUS_11425 [Rubrimonas sp.]|uniref:hypothetical protein n=1 Tax=Rubrimonas sp. TaxID=2036015 RepID=UPI002FDD4D5F
MRAAVALCALLVAGAAAAQAPLPSSSVAPEDRERFRVCRAAIFYQLGAPPGENNVPHAAAQALLEQMNLIMFETVRTAPAATVDDGRKALEFVEQFFLSFSRTISETRERLANPVRREEILLDCMPWIWGIVKERIDYLILWRERVIDAPPYPNRLGEQLKR